MYDDECPVYIPLFDDMGDANYIQRSCEGFPAFDEEILTAEEFIETLDEIRNKCFPVDHIFEVLIAYFGGGSSFDPLAKKSLKIKAICPVGLFARDKWLIFLHTMEEWSSQYHVLPYEGGILNQSDEVFEAFNLIMATRAYFKNKQMEPLMTNLKKGASKHR